MMRVWGMTDIGLVRKDNQDAYAVREQTATGHTICVVCDGMGGAAGGCVASSIAVTTFIEELEKVLTPEMSPEQLREASSYAVALSNRAIRDAADREEAYRGMGTTLVSAVSYEGGVVVTQYDDLSHTVKLCAMFDTLHNCADIAEESGIRMNLEALNVTTDHVGNFLTSTQMAAELTAMVGSPLLKILYDVYHMQLNEGSLCDNIRRYAGQIGHVHVADAPGRHEPGTGEINYRAVYSCLAEAGYRGFIGYELFPKTTPAEAVKAIMAD